MKSQIFKNIIPNEKLFGFLDKICVKYSNYYLFDKCAYKKGLLNNDIVEFLNECKQYYHISKQSYIDKPLTFNSLVTIIRQICKQNKITYTSKIKYDKSDYEIVHYIYFMSSF